MVSVKYMIEDADRQNRGGIIKARCSSNSLIHIHTYNLFRDEGNESSLKYENECSFLDRPSYKYLIKYIPPLFFYTHIHIHLGENSLIRTKWWPRSLGVSFQWIVIIISYELRNRRSSHAYPHFTSGTVFKITVIKVCVHIHLAIDHSENVWYKENL